MTDHWAQHWGWRDVIAYGWWGVRLFLLRGFTRLTGG